MFKAANTIRELPAGTVLFEFGDKGEEMFGVVTGEIDLRLPDGDVLKVGPDDTFGEMAVVDGSPRSATAVAVVDTSVAVIDKRTFLFLVHETPMFKAWEAMLQLANRLRASPPGPNGPIVTWRAGIPGRRRPTTLTAVACAHVRRAHASIRPRPHP